VTVTIGSEGGFLDIFAMLSLFGPFLGNQSENGEDEQRHQGEQGDEPTEVHYKYSCTIKKRNILPLCVFPITSRLRRYSPPRRRPKMQRLTQLLDLDALAGDDRFPIRALFHDADSRRLQMAAIDIGGWLDRREVLVSLDRFGAPGDDAWPVSMTRDELHDAPEWTDDSAAASALPPLIVGPFGYTFSPMLMAAGMATSADRTVPADPDEGNADLVSRSGGRVKNMERCSDLLGRDAFGPGGNMGKVADLVIEDMTVTGIITEDDTRVPLARLRHIAEQGHFVFD